LPVVVNVVGHVTPRMPIRVNICVRVHVPTGRASHADPQPRCTAAGLYVDPR
jgi:hypothetical protein